MPQPTLSDRFTRPLVSWLDECRGDVSSSANAAPSAYVPRRLRDHSRKSKMSGIVF